MPIADSPIEEARHEAADETLGEESEAGELQERYEPERREPPRHAPAERRDFRPAPPAAIADAIAEVNHIIASLKQVLDEMEEVLETLELAEVQKSADEREIQSLRNALRQFERRGGGEPRHEQQGHHGHSQRHDSRRGRQG
jgi:hypothetical protein